MSEAPAKRKYGRNQKLIDLLKRRGYSVATVAKSCFCGRSSVIQILAGARRGSQTWNKLKQVMTAEELAVAMEFANRRLRDQQGCFVRLNESAVVEVVDIPPAA